MPKGGAGTNVLIDRAATACGTRKAEIEGCLTEDAGRPAWPLHQLADTGTPPTGRAPVPGPLYADLYAPMPPAGVPPGPGPLYADLYAPVPPAGTPRDPDPPGRLLYAPVPGGIDPVDPGAPGPLYPGGGGVPRSPEALDAALRAARALNIASATPRAAPPPKIAKISLLLSPPPSPPLG
jgi:hypothetical protein